jgi:protein-S-isoprenylcysteine O-methyltransferase Ste14
MRARDLQVGYPQRLLDWLLGLSVLSWAVLGLVHSPAEDRFTTVRLVIAALNSVVGVLLLARTAALRHGRLGEALLCLPAVVIPGVALRLAPPPHQWSVPGQVLFAAGAAGTLTSLLFLGRSFAFLPALRTTVASGPYRVVRHPAYACELLMVAACLAARPSLAAAAVLPAALALTVVRILMEERLLATHATYRAYRQRVPWRLLPHAW